MRKYEKTLNYIHTVNSLFCNPGLERISGLCESLGNPQEKCKFIHVAGTNGKGSTSKMLAKILTLSGYKTGLYTSPYVRKFNERIRIGERSISNSDLIRLTEAVRPIAEKMEDKPTEFELITAIAFLYFCEQKCDFVVLECGLGGRFDATNIIESPCLSVITGISLDHMNILGDTIEKIAYEKAGIIKPSAPVIFGGNSLVAKAVIEKEAKKKCSPFYTVDYEKLKIKSFTLSGTAFDFDEYKNVKISLLGEYQPRNAALVLSAVDILKKSGVKIPERTIYEGLKKVKWNARFEIIKKEPLVIFDGAHNAEGIEAACKSVKMYFGDEKVTVISGVLKDKEYEKIAQKISEIADKVFTVTPENQRALDASEYSKVIEKNGVPASPCQDIKTALEKALEYTKKKESACIILGSLYTYSEVAELINKI